MHIIELPIFTTIFDVFNVILIFETYTVADFVIGADVYSFSPIMYFGVIFALILVFPTPTGVTTPVIESTVATSSFELDHSTSYVSVVGHPECFGDTDTLNSSSSPISYIFSTPFTFPV